MKNKLSLFSLLLATVFMAAPVLAQEASTTSDRPMPIKEIRQELNKEQEEAREAAKQQMEKNREEAKQKQELLREEAKQKQEELKTQAEKIREEAKTNLRSATGTKLEVKKTREQVKVDTKAKQEALREEAKKAQEALKAQAEKNREDAKNKMEQTREELKTQREQNHSTAITALQNILSLATSSSSTTAVRIRRAAENQAQNQEKLATNLEKLQEQNKLAKFFFGPKLKEAKEAQTVIADNNSQIKELETAKAEISDATEQEALTEQIKVLQEANANTAATVEQSQKGFSLFGWVNRIFGR